MRAHAVTITSTPMAVPSQGGIVNSVQSFSEVPEPDRMEQAQDLDDPEGVVGTEPTGEDAQPTGSFPAVREADGADVAEQSVEVGLDDEDHPQT